MSTHVFIPSEINLFSRFVNRGRSVLFLFLTSSACARAIYEQNNLLPPSFSSESEQRHFRVWPTRLFRNYGLPCSLLLLPIAVLLVSSSIFEISRHVFLGLRIAVLPPFFPTTDCRALLATDCRALFTTDCRAPSLFPFPVRVPLPIAGLPPFFRFRSGRHFEQRHRIFQFCRQNIQHLKSWTTFLQKQRIWMTSSRQSEKS